jgi:UDP-N-acetylglucosamine 2-epimerase (non-hydrolysing)
MSEVFFDELGLPEPDVNLGVGSGTHGAQTAALLVAMEAAFTEQTPDRVVVYGDVNSTLAAALTCAKLLIPVAHVEAGLRSFDVTMPEEINRRVTDLLSDPLFVTAPEGEQNLAREGITGERVVFVGNPMIDTLLANLERFDPEPVKAELGIAAPYAVATLHRPANVDTAQAAAALVDALRAATSRLPLVLPLHPRGRARLEAAGLGDVPDLLVVEPLGYIDFISLVRGAAAVITDSGGIQEETTVLDVPCLTLRPNTERPITLTAGTNRLVTTEGLGDALDGALAGAQKRIGDGPPGWDGHAGERIAAALLAL